MSDRNSTINWLIRDFQESWDAGFETFIQSPWGIGILFILLFWFLNNRRRRM